MNHRVRSPANPILGRLAAILVTVVAVTSLTLVQPPLSARAADDTASAGSVDSAIPLPPEVADTPVDEIIVQYAPGTPATDASGAVNGSEQVSTEDVAVGDSLGRGFRTVKLDRTVTADVASEVAAELAASPEILAASPNMPVTFSDATDTIPPIEIQELSTDGLEPTTTQPSPMSWGLDRIDQRSLPLNNSYSYAQSGSGVSAYVIDNGVRPDHQDFLGRIGAGYSAYGDGCFYSTGGSAPGHGTHVAGTIGGTLAGVAKAVTIIPVRVFSCAGGGDSAHLISGINWVIGNHVAGQPAVANLSLTVGSVNTVLDMAINGMISDGITVAVASGNAAADACASSPAHVTGAITVNATTSDDAVAGFSNYGACTDIFAPGQGIWSAWPTAANAYAQLDGTSMAAPHVAGLAAQILSESGDLPPGVVTAIIGFRATPFSGGGSNNPKILAYEPSALSTYTSTSLPTISGLAEVGQTLTASPGSWSPAPTGFAYQWRRDGVDIAGANSATYTVEADDEGQAVTVSATALKAGYVSTTTNGASFVTPSAAVRFASLTPARMADTRSGLPSATADGQNPRVGSVPAGGIMNVPILGRVGIPSTGVDAVVLNVTAVAPTASGHARVFPRGEALPNASSLNFSAGTSIPNLVVVKVGTEGSISIYNAAGNTHFIVDVTGYFPTIDGYSPLSPTRLVDTRDGGVTVDHVNEATGAVGSEQSLQVPVLGRGGVPSSGVSAVVLNVTAVAPTSGGHLRVYPTGESLPNVSNLNFSAGKTIPNLVIAKVGAQGSVSIYNAAGFTHLVVDVAGYFPEGTGYSSLTPSRLVDTRSGGQTIDHANEGTGAVGAEQSIKVPVLGRGGVPASGVTAVVVNVTAVAPTAGGHLRVYPTGEALPNTSNVNFSAGTTIPNLVVAKVGADGSISIYNAAGFTHIIVDVAGYFVTP